MPTMLRMIFEEDLIKSIQEKTGKETKIHGIEKSSGQKYRGLSFHGSPISPVVNLDILFSEYLGQERTVGADEAFATCVDKAIRLLNTPVPEQCLTNEDFLDWSKVKSHVYPRLVPKNEKTREMPHYEVADLYMIFAVRAFATDSGVGEAVIFEELMDTWNVTIDTLYLQAMDNLANEDFKLMNPEDLGVMYILTNKRGCKGAVECLNPKAIARIQEEIGEVFVIPSSVDEVLLIPKKARPREDNLRFLRAMLADVNSTTVEEKDILSYSVYEYIDGALEVAL